VLHLQHNSNCCTITPSRTKRQTNDIINLLQLCPVVAAEELFEIVTPVISAVLSLYMSLP
jgi:hypothetical protein